MKRKILLTIMALCLVFSTIFMVSSCAMFARRVSVTYDKERGIVEGEGKYKKGKQVTLTATAYDGYVFQGWYDISTLLSTENTYVFKMGKKPVNLTLVTWTQYNNWYLRYVPSGRLNPAFLIGLLKQLFLWLL